MTTTDTDTTVFEEIVEGVVPMSHLVCTWCHPGASLPSPQGGLFAVCGVKLLGEEPDPGAEQCEECFRLWPWPHLKEAHL